MLNIPVFLLAVTWFLPIPDSVTLQAVETMPANETVGVASWYGVQQRGHATANGERFDPSHRTAAHRDLPLGSWVKVTNLENRRSVLVRINDRGPFAPGRIIDLSERAAHDLRMTRVGLTNVRLETVSAP